MSKIWWSSALGCHCICNLIIPKAAHVQNWVAALDIDLLKFRDLQILTPIYATQRELMKIPWIVFKIHSGKAVTIYLISIHDINRVTYEYSGQLVCSNEKHLTPRKVDSWLRNLRRRVARFPWWVSWLRKQGLRQVAWSKTGQFTTSFHNRLTTNHTSKSSGLWLFWLFSFVLGAQEQHCSIPNSLYCLTRCVVCTMSGYLVLSLQLTGW